MGRFVSADADRPGWRTRERRRLRDIEFLERLRNATEEELDQLVWESRRRPPWQQIAIVRAVARQGAR